jgi:hypothetical protein
MKKTKIEFEYKGLELVADVIATPYLPAKTSGRPEDCYEAEGGECEFVSLLVNGVDVSVLISDSVWEELTTEALKSLEEKDFDDSLNFP